MFRIKGPVLAAATFDEATKDVLRQADALARFHRVKLIVCHVLAEIYAVRPLFPYLHMEDALKSADLESRVRKELKKTIRAATRRDASRESIVIERGTVHSGILRAAEDLGAGAIVVGGKKVEDRLSASARIAERVTRHANCPVLLVRPSPRKGKVLAATDFSDPSMPAIEAASAEARRLRTSLTIIHAMDILPLMLPTIEGVSYPVLPEHANAHIRESSKKELDNCVRRFKAKGGGILYEGDAAEAIVNAASELPARLVVVGTHGRTGLSRIALGSVAEAVLRTAPVSVLVVRIPKSGEIK